MKDKSQILVPVDFSNASLKALDYATNIAQQMNKKVIVVNTIKAPKLVNNDSILSLLKGWNTSKNPIDALFMHKLYKKNKRRLRGLKLSWNNHHVISKTSIGFSSKEPMENIMDLVNHYDPFMLVLPYSKHSDFEQYFSSNFSLDVLRNVKIPTLFVPEKTVVKKIENVVFPSGFSDDVNMDFLNVIKRITKSFNSNLHLVKVLKDEEKALEAEVEMIDFANRKSLRNYQVNSITAEYVGDALDIHQQAVKADLICLMTKGKSGISQLFYSDSMTENLLKVTDKPILSMSLKGDALKPSRKSQIQKKVTGSIVNELTY